MTDEDFWSPSLNDFLSGNFISLVLYKGCPKSSSSTL